MVFLFTVVKYISLVEIIHAVYQRHIFKNMIWSEFENWICMFLIYLNNLNHCLTSDMAHAIWVFKVVRSGSCCLSATRMVQPVSMIFLQTIISKYTELTGTALAKTAKMLIAIFENFILSFSFKFALMSVRLLW